MMLRATIAVVVCALLTVPAAADMVIQEGDFFESLKVDGDVVMTGGLVENLEFDYFHEGTLQVSGGRINYVLPPLGATVIEGGQIGPRPFSNYPLVIEGGTLDVKGGAWLGGIYRSDAQTAFGISTINFHGSYFKYWGSGNPNQEYASYWVEGWLLDGSFISIPVTNGVTDMAARMLPINFVIDPSAPVGGDTNGDGAVDLEDLNAVRNHFGTPGGLAEGDLDRSGVVDLADVNLVRNNFGTHFTTGGNPVTVSGPLPGTGPGVVPEPAAVWLAMVGGLGALARCRRRS